MRTPEQRKADVLSTFERNADLWIATASRSGRPHLVAVSAWWHSPDFVIATVGSSRTARNLDATDVARLALGAPDDVIVIDARLTQSVAVGDADETLQAGFAAAVGWNPIEEPGSERSASAAPTSSKHRRTSAVRGAGPVHASNGIVPVLIVETGSRGYFRPPAEDSSNVLRPSGRRPRLE